MTSSLKVLVSFDGADGSCPSDGLAFDATGDLLGTTAIGGPADAGTVFEIAKSPGGYADAPITLAGFDGAAGCGAAGALISDTNGDLFGTSTAGGAYGFGSIFEIANTGDGYSAPIALVNFNGVNGANPTGSLITDAAGDLFGTTCGGGEGGTGLGTVFEITNSATGYAGTPTILASFDSSTGYDLEGGLVADANGDLFGTTSCGGAYDPPLGDGTVYEIAKTATGYAPAATLVSFDGGSPQAGLIADADGNLFGTMAGGGAYGLGAVFEIVRSPTGYATTPTVLASFSGSDGSWPRGSLIADAEGNLFGTTQMGGADNDGTVFEIANTTAGYSADPITLASFNDATGSGPMGSLIADASGDLFGTTTWGGEYSADYGNGTVFEITGSGFVPFAPKTTAADDFAGSGTSDILFRDPATGSIGDFLMNNGQPGWASIGWASPGLQVAGVGDFNGDGTADILLRDPVTGGFSQFVMDGNQPTWAPVGWADPSLQVAGVGDFNGDGTADILLRNAATGAMGDFLMQNGSPTWAPVGQAGTNWQVAGVGDFNGDGTSDILFHDPTTGAIGMFAMHDNVPVWVPIGQADPSYQVAGVGDFNGDGTDDILFRDPTTGAIGDFLMHGGSPTWAPVGQAAANWQVAGVGDYYGTGTDDILLGDPTTGGLSMFHMAGNVPTWAPIGATATNWQIAG